MVEPVLTPIGSITCVETVQIFFEGIDYPETRTGSFNTACPVDGGQGVTPYTLLFVHADVLSKPAGLHLHDATLVPEKSKATLVILETCEEYAHTRLVNGSDVAGFNVSVLGLPLNTQPAAKAPACTTPSPWSFRYQHCHASHPPPA